MTLPTLILTPMLAAVILLSAVQVARMARGWAASRAAGFARGERRDRIALEDEKVRLLTTIRDLEFEHAMGKLSDEDYAALRGRFEGRAVRVIEQLERLEEAS
ncbi:MAG: hypothetical protein ACQEXJ_07065 [Myxococcota bacterium]